MRAFEWCVLLASGLTFAPALFALSQVWFGVHHYSHGPLVLLVSLVMAVQHSLVRGGPIDPRDRSGLLVLAVALAVHAGGLMLGSTSLQGLAWVVAVAGGVRFFWGAAGLRALAFPVGFLLFAVPVPEAWLSPFILELQLGASSAASGLLSAAGVSIAREGNVLTLPDGATLFVAEACSGITSIVTLTPLALLLGYLTQRRWRRRAAIVACVIPVALLCNGLRIVTTVFLAREMGVERATGGAFHELTGAVTFLFSCALVVGVGAGFKFLPGEGLPPGHAA